MSERGQQQYPNSDASGNPIPFDVGDPYGMFIDSIGIAASSAIVIPNTDNLTLIAVFIATCRCIISWDGTDPVTTEEVFKTNQAIIPIGSHKLLLPGLSIKNISADGSSTGKLYCMVYRAWKAGGVEVMKNSI